jgi:hypothetical protein
MLCELEAAGCVPKDGLASRLFLALICSQQGQSSCLQAGIPAYTGCNVSLAVSAGLRWYTCTTLVGVECQQSTRCHRQRCS